MARPEDLMDTIAGEWESFRSLFPTAPVDQLVMMRQTFYAGAVAMSSLIGRGHDCSAELTAYGRRLREQMAKKVGKC